jgi:menaquinone-dependent protoporphyrinogen oxidase
MGRILLIYSSQQGQTKKISENIAADLKAHGHETFLVDCVNLSASLDVKSYDGVIIGASVNIGSFPKKLRLWVKENSKALTAMPSYYFSVCLGILQKEEKVQNEERKIVLDFLSATNWVPAHWEIFAGALAYSKYNWLVKWMMRRIARKAGVETDWNRDYEFTDWVQVHRFAERFCNELRSPVSKLEAQT